MYRFFALFEKSARACEGFSLAPAHFLTFFTFSARQVRMQAHRDEFEATRIVHFRQGSTNDVPE